MIADWIQVIIAGIALYLGIGYLKQHDKKISLERRRLAAENGLRALIKVDQILQSFFSLMEIAPTEEYVKIKQLANSKTVNLPEERSREGADRVLHLLVFKRNFQKYQNSLLDYHKEVNLNGMLLKDPQFDKLNHEFDNSLASITNVMIFKSDRMMRNKINLEQLDWFEQNVPLSMSDSKNILVQEYDKAGIGIRNFFLSKT